MSEKIVVAILTYRRPQYLDKTLSSFFDLNQTSLDKFVFVAVIQDRDRLTEKVFNKFKKHFQWIKRITNVGCAEGWNVLMREILQQMPEYRYILYLQDDWMSVGPVSAFTDELMGLLALDHEIGQIRLREQRSRVCKKNRISGLKIVYQPRTENIDKSDAHFTFNPTLMRMEAIKRMVPIKKELAGMIKFHNLGFKSGQLKANCFTHIGVERAVTAVANGFVWLK